MNTNNDEPLKIAAESGDIDLLYTVIRNDPYIFEHIDLIPFVETPLHIAASEGHLQFATEIMMLKPSFSWKLNVQGFSPIHLAMQNGQTTMVSRFVNINKELVKVQGREGITPLHFASQIGEVDLLTSFLEACPESIEYLTVRCENALHIAVKNGQFKVLEILVRWLKSNCETGSRELEKKILNQKDEAGNTILHISALMSEAQAQARLLVKTRINLKAKNLENNTALDIAATPEMKKILLSAGAKSASQVTDTATPADILASDIPMLQKWLIFISRINKNISEEQRSTWMIVATLVATATYESMVSPPGGVYQATASAYNVGKSVLSNPDFRTFCIMNMTSFYISIIAILILTPADRIIGSLMPVPVGFFVYCYLSSMDSISPITTTFYINIILEFSIGFACLTLPAMLVYHWLRGHLG